MGSSMGGSVTGRSVSVSRSGSKKAYTCLAEKCSQKPFSRSADLDRHYKQVHLGDAEKEHYLCDYAKCRRSGDSFHRKDHYRDHLREYHKEDLLKRGGGVGNSGGSNGSGSGGSGSGGGGGGGGGSSSRGRGTGGSDSGSWLDERAVSRRWCRCTRCLIRIAVNSTGWECPSCKTQCEPDRRQRRT